MSCKFADLLPQYAAGVLDEASSRAVAGHLDSCRECRGELALWRQVGAAIHAGHAADPLPSPGLVEGALTRARRARPTLAARAWALLAAQAPLVRGEIWPASALVMAIGYLAAVLLGGQRGGAIIQALAPIVAAAGLAMIYGAENDPGLELALATPTSPRQVLLARLALVYGYNLLLALAASAALLVVVPSELLGAIILGWLAPMTFLSALALVLSLCIGTGNAVTVAFLLWLGRGLAGGLGATSSAAELALAAALRAYAQAWHSPGLLFSLAGALILAAVWLAGRQERLLPGPT